MQIQANMKMAEIIHLDYHLLQIISRFGINLGFGDKTVKQVCDEYNLNVDFFLEIVNSYHLESYFPQKNLQAFSLSLIIKYLRKSHEYYLTVKIPEIASLLHRLTSASGITGPIMQHIDQFFSVYKNELEHHIQREEEKVYPYVFEVEKAFMDKKPEPEIIDQIGKYSIIDYESEHDNVEDKLLDLKNLLIKYIPVPVDSNLSESILFELFRLENDLRDHARIEDKILVPKVRYMEKWLLGLTDITRSRHTDRINEELSHREKEVLKLVALGLTNKVIAEKLYISTHTVITHRKNITAKLGIKTIAGLTVYAVINKLITPEEINNF